MWRIFEATQWEMQSVILNNIIYIFQHFRIMQMLYMNFNKCKDRIQKKKKENMLFVDYVGFGIVIPLEWVGLKTACGSKEASIFHWQGCQSRLLH